MEVVEDSRRKEMASLDWSCQDGAIMNLESNFSRFELFPTRRSNTGFALLSAPSALPWIAASKRLYQESTKAE
jgi:hypothetical protein